MSENLNEETSQQERLEKFRTEYQKIVSETDFDFFAFPQFVPTKDGAFEVKVVMNLVDKQSVKKDEVIKE